jgi:O-acetyl-ADP-ribose deacetylase (regulator of RNase III)
MSLLERFESIEADITTLALDAIVNAANEPLIMGGGVDSAIRRKAGPDIEVELRKYGRCPTGTAIITRGHRLPAKFVIHTVAPVFGDGSARAEEKERLLADCYRNTLKLADERDISSIAFPCIGTGIYGWPPDRAAEIAFGAVRTHLERGGRQTRVVFCCFSGADKARYDGLIAKAQ